MLVEGDNTGKWARRLKDIVEGYIDHLGGRAEAGTARLAIVRRVAAIELALEAMEGGASISPDEFDVDKYQRSANTHRRLIETLGLNPRPRTVGHDPIGDYFSQPPARTA